MPVLERKISNTKIYTKKVFFWQHQIRPKRKIEQLYVTEYKMANRNPIKAKEILPTLTMYVATSKCKNANMVYTKFSSITNVSYS